MKRTLALMLSLVLLLCILPAVQAAGTGSITISNTTIGKDYSIYKIFDSTHATGGSPVAYTYKLNGTTDTDNLYKALTASDSPFKLTLTTVTDVYNVVVVSGKTGSDISSFLKEKVIDTNLVTATQTLTADAATETFSNLDFGYYYVKSSLGAAVSIDTTTPSMTLIDKNQKPGWDNEAGNYPTETETTNKEIGKFVADYVTITTPAYAKSNTAGINDEVIFKINAFVPKYNGDKKVTEYNITDTLDNGFSYVSASLEVFVDGTKLSETTDYTASVTGQVLTITLPTKDTWDSEPHLSFTYRATVNDKAVYDNENNVSLTWKERPWNDDTATADTTTDTPLTSKTDTYVMGFSIDKQDKNENKLTGAKFKLYDAATAGNEIKVVKTADGKYRKALPTETGVEIEAGEAMIFGFDEGKYYLNETQTPKGYMILESRVEVEISKATTNTTGDQIGYKNTTIVIKNEPGKKLPGTGGEGTYAYFIGGGVLVLVAAILLLARRKSTSK